MVTTTVRLQKPDNSFYTEGYSERRKNFVEIFKSRWIIAGFIQDRLSLLHHNADRMSEPAMTSWVLLEDSVNLCQILVTESTGLNKD